MNTGFKPEVHQDNPVLNQTYVMHLDRQLCIFIFSFSFKQNSLNFLTSDDKMPVVYIYNCKRWQFN